MIGYQVELRAMVQSIHAKGWPVGVSEWGEIIIWLGVPKNQRMTKM